MYNLDNYIKILRCITKYYKNEFFNTNSIDNSSKSVVIIRHDIDYSLSKALEMAKLESSLGIKTTYLVMVSSPFYNIFEKINRERLQEICTLGHQVGLHFYTPVKLIEKKEVIIKKINEEFSIFKKCVYDVESVVSWHNPSAKLIKQMDSTSLPFINTYNTRFIKDFLYIADSNCRYTPVQIIKLLKQSRNTNIHLLIHPSIWILEKKSMEEVLVTLFIENCKEIEKGFAMNNVWNKRFPMGFSRDFYRKLESEINSLFKSER